MRILAAILALSAWATAAGPALAQDDTNARILETVDTFLRSINERDPSLMASVTIPDGSVTAIRLQPDRNLRRTRTFADDIARNGEGSETLHEVYWDPTVLVSGDIAIVWAPYSFDIDGRRSHCGIDVFNLARIDKSWIIVGVHYTLATDGCPQGR